jgi:glycosyltransferase involved in cell wall biosynthesis
MKILINCPSNFNISHESIKKKGGIETLNYDLAMFLSKQKMKISISSICKKNIKKNNILNLPIKLIKKNSQKYKFDAIISSNDSCIFNYFPNSKKFLWMHNKLQIEKSIRKKQLFSIFRNKPIVIFVSKYLKDATSKIYPFKKRYVIPNFLPSDFISNANSYKRNPIFVWSVQREKGLNDTIDMWINNIYTKSKRAKFYILGINKLKQKYTIKFLKSKNIFFIGRVSKKKLKKIYEKSTAMICLGYDETFCLNALEANSCGLPVLTFGKSALNELILNNYNGFIVNNFKDLSIKILSFLKLNALEQQKFRDNALIFSKKYHLSNVIYKWLKLLK